MNCRLLAGALAAVIFCAGTPAVSAGQEAPAAAGQSLTDFSGAWIGTLRIPEAGERWQPSALRVVFSQRDHVLQGSLALGQSKTSIANGRVETTQFGTSLSFQLRGSDFVMHFELRPDGHVLRGLARIDGTRRPAPVELRREPDPSEASSVKASAETTAATPQAPGAGSPEAAARALEAASKPYGFSGIYAGSFTLAGNTLSMYTVLTQTGNDLTGTVGPDAARQKAIVNGKVESTAKGAVLRFEMDLETEQVVMTFELSPAAGGLRGTVTAEHANQRVAGTVELKPLR